ncbi:MAG: LysM peptidoglycan-binding domain-containing protein [Candidatus Puniceispirillales bacterium]
MKQAPLILIALSIIVAATSIGVFFYSTQPSQTDLAATTAVEKAAEPAPEPAEVEPAETGAEAPATGDATTAEQATAETEAIVQQQDEEDLQEAQQEARAEAAADRGITLARVRPDGSAVIAGNAPPGSTVTLMIGDKTIGSTVATDQGEWVVVPDDLLEPGSHLVTVTVTHPDGTTEVEALALVIEILSGDETPLVALVPYTVEEAPVVVLQAPDTAEAAAVAEADTSMAAEQEAAPRVAMAPMVTIRSIQAFNPGYISVGGRAEGGASVRLSVNDAETPPSPVGPQGLYQLGQSIASDANQAMIKVTLHDDAGAIVASARLRLSRGQIETTLSSNTLVVVQKGDALWRIAYQTYGRGIRYVDIYRQNASIIRDPDLIYPDQIFVVPNS